MVAWGSNIMNITSCRWNKMNILDKIIPCPDMFLCQDRFINVNEAWIKYSNLYREVGCLWFDYMPTGMGESIIGAAVVEIRNMLCVLY